MSPSSLFEELILIILGFKSLVYLLLSQQQTCIIKNITRQSSFYHRMTPHNISSYQDIQKEARMRIQQKGFVNSN